MLERQDRQWERRRGTFARKIEGLELSQILLLWPVALAVGTVTGFLVIGFMEAIHALQTLFYGSDDRLIHSAASDLPWWIVLPIPVCGGLAVGLILVWLTPDGKARGVSDVIRAAALSGGRVAPKPGIASALAALVTLSTGGSSGREGPAVHIGAVLAGWVSDRLKAPPITGRDILGCAAAAAVSASFNAPLAGAVFALEVVLRHYALHTFGPIVIASVAAAVVGRLYRGNVTEFLLPESSIGFYTELPAFMILGLVAGLGAVAFMRGLFIAESVADKVQVALKIPRWGRPAVAGLLLGLIAIWFPHIIGVGYETTSLALTSRLGFWTLVLFALVKALAVAVTYAGHMGGGVFSPALMLGALVGSGFGGVAIDIVPSVSGSQGLYALAGMGAVAGAVLGAPISTTLIVFELTGDWQAAIAVMVTVSTASLVTAQMVARSFFLTQLERSGLHLAAGPTGYLAATIKAVDLMRHRGADNGAPDTACWELYSQGSWLSRTATLETALPLFDRLKGPYLPVLIPATEPGGQPELIGALYHVDALRAYARALEAELNEEHS